MRSLQLMSVTLTGLPPTVNHLYRTARNSRRYKTREGKEWQEAAAATFAERYSGMEPYTGDVQVEVIFLTPDKRRWDIDNRIKALMDALMMGGVIKDDAQVKSLRVDRERGIRRALTVVSVREWAL